MHSIASNEDNIMIKLYLWTFDDSEPTSLGSELRRASYIDFTKYKRKQAILKKQISAREKVKYLHYIGNGDK